MNAALRRRVSSIVIVAPSLDILGGQGVQAALLLEALRRDGARASLLAVNPRFCRGARWIRRLPYVRTLVNQLLYLPSLWRLADADVAHVFSASYWSFLLAPVPAMLAGRALGKRVILHYHSGEAADHLERWGALVHPWLKLAHEIVVPSEYLRGVFGRHGYAARVIPNIVELPGFRFRARRPLQPRIVSLRNLEPYYRIDLVLDAFDVVRRSAPDATLTVAGCGSEERRLRAQAERLGIAHAVRFAGRVEPADIPRLLDQADIFLNASELDNQPVSILEAFAAGTPVVTTPPGDIPAMVRDGVSGVIVPAGDPQALAGAVLGLVADPERAARLARNARRSLDQYTWAAVRDAWHEVYLEAIAPASSAAAFDAAGSPVPVQQVFSSDD